MSSTLEPFCRCLVIVIDRLVNSCSCAQISCGLRSMLPLFLKVGVLKLQSVVFRGSTVSFILFFSFIIWRTHRAGKKGNNVDFSVLELAGCCSDFSRFSCQESDFAWSRTSLEI